MSQQSIILDRATQWDTICFPIKSVPLASLLPTDYQLLPTDRQLAIVGEQTLGKKSIFALQSAEYSLVPNELLRRVAEREFPNHNLDVHFTHQGEFSINLILPDEINIFSKSGDTKTVDRLYKSMILNNSYSGKTPFTLQGTALKEHTTTRTESKMRVSYYREICSNGLMGWADDYLTMDEYLTWLMNGKPKKYKDALKIKDAELVELTKQTENKETDILIQKKFHHKGLNLDWFEQHLTNIFQEFKRKQHSLTPTIYKNLVQHATPENLGSIFSETGLPKMLARTALERMQKEERELKTSANLWLAYNAVNYSLFSSRSSLSINERYRLDEAAFHQLAKLALS